MMSALDIDGSLLKKLLITSDLILADGRRVKLMRTAIVLNVVYTVIFGVMFVDESLRLVASGSLTDISIETAAKQVFLIIVIGGHLMGLFGITQKKYILLLISSGIGMPSVGIYYSLIAYHLYSLPIVLIMLGVVISHTQLGLSFIAFLIAIDMSRRVDRNKIICRPNL